MRTLYQHHWTIEYSKSVIFLSKINVFMFYFDFLRIFILNFPSYTWSVGNMKTIWGESWNKPYIIDIMHILAVKLRVLVEKFEIDNIVRYNVTRVSIATLTLVYVYGKASPIFRIMHKYHAGHFICISTYISIWDPQRVWIKRLISTTHV